MEHALPRAATPGAPGHPAETLRPRVPVQPTAEDRAHGEPPAPRTPLRRTSVRGQALDGLRAARQEAEELRRSTNNAD